jgi:tRNA dimethylallyltransferase
MNRPLIVVLGPTASGKSALAVSLAEALDGEVVSGDSVQVYRGLDIGAGKITPEEARGIPHHLVDIKDPWESFSVAEFQTLARSAIADIHQRGRIPILAGGTGLYIGAAVDPYEFGHQEQEAASRYREGMRRLAAEKGNACLHALLARKDPVTAANVHPNDVKRIVRALEFFETQGRPISSNQGAKGLGTGPPGDGPSEAGSVGDPLYQTRFIGLRWEREQLYRRINDRVDAMIRKGWVEEARRLLEMGVPEDAQSMQAIGYRHIVGFLNRGSSWDSCVEQIKMETRRFAKRQMTWFRRNPRIFWLDAGGAAGKFPDDPVRYILSDVLGGFVSAKNIRDRKD